MALASTEVLFVLPMSIFLYVFNLKTAPPLPYVSWKYVHANFSRIAFISRFLLDQNKTQIVVFELSRWCMPIAAFLFFIFFGLASEARKQYRVIWYGTLSLFGVEPPHSFTDSKDTP
jgi:pheromone a factor receptor